MRFLLNRQWANRLCALPESGMGFQRVDIVLRDGEKVKNVLVLNARHVEWPNEKRAISSDDIAEIMMSREGGRRHRSASQ